MPARRALRHSRSGKLRREPTQSARRPQSPHERENHHPRIEERSLQGGQGPPRSRQLTEEVVGEGPQVAPPSLPPSTSRPATRGAFNLVYVYPVAQRRDQR